MKPIEIMNILKESEEINGKMKLIDVLDKLFGGSIDIDVCDNDIDMCVALCYDKDSKDGSEYDKFIEKLVNNVDVVKQINTQYGPELICDFSSYLKPYNEEWKKFFNMDNSEFDEDEAYYEAVVNLEPLIAGNASESTYKEINDILDGKTKISESHEWKNTIENTDKYGKQVTGATYRGYTIKIEDNEYCIKDKDGNTIFSSGVKNDVIKKIDELVDKKLTEDEDFVVDDEMLKRYATVSQKAESKRKEMFGTNFDIYKQSQEVKDAIDAGKTDCSSFEELINEYESNPDSDWYIDIIKQAQMYVAKQELKKEGKI